MAHCFAHRLAVSGLTVGYEAVRFSDERRGIRGLFGLNRITFSVLTNLTFSIDFTTPIIGVVGANGAGKSTLLRALAGLLPSSGSVTWAGESIEGMSHSRRIAIGIIYIPIEGGLFERLSVRENIFLMAQDGPERVLDAFRDLATSIPGVTSTSLAFLSSNDQAGNLSGGQKRLLSLARLLVHRYSLVLIDEPTAGLSDHWLDLYRGILERAQPAAVLQVEQRSRVRMLRSLGARVYALENGALAATEEA